MLPVGEVPDFEGILRIILEEKVPIVETAGRNPAAVITTLKKAGVVVIHKCVTTIVQCVLCAVCCVCVCVCVCA